MFFCQTFPDKRKNYSNLNCVPVSIFLAFVWLKHHITKQNLYSKKTAIITAYAELPK
jgi:hypothetical protein